MRNALILVAIMLNAAPGLAAPKPSLCPSNTSRVELEAGKYSPPATLAPDISRNGGRYQLWTHLRANGPDSRVTINCLKRGGQPLKHVLLPARVDQCEWRSGRISCH